MAVQKREKTNYPGVFFRMGKRKGKSGEERIYYIVFKQDNKTIEEKVGRQYSDHMTPAKASGIRSERIEGKRTSRKEKREQEKVIQNAELNKYTIDRLWNLYHEHALDRKSIKTDEYNFDLHLKNDFGKLQPSEIITLQVDKLKHNLLKSGKASQTVKHIMGLLRRIIRFGVKKGLCGAIDPSKLYFEMPKVDNQRTESLNSIQLKNYLGALDKEVDQNSAAFLRLALFTGMRKGALMALKWEDIDFEADFIVLRGDAAKKGKTERIPMSKLTKEIFNSIERTPSLYVFPGKNGEQRKDFKRIAQRVRDNAGLPKDFRPLHGLRHAYASFLASSGQVDLYTLQKLLTHSSPLMTQRYAHLADEALQRAAGVIDLTFGNTNKINK
ncbi:tyrosine-type recombinase/integrase [Desulfovibrio litoralis]|uniref:Site-specific recombinase XerD n=1 Tax=Desulfovibrio litoralis DSM 11393 TaxID=1121455 RepID=A0A1M7TH74_9BACT|nr:site-specific integrase [Desulfovibrio litoralis]SHN70094.1 Site-specific recombinase XerD [Desulfovibrio litoralis DSM 11393]